MLRCGIILQHFMLHRNNYLDAIPAQKRKCKSSESEVGSADRGNRTP